MESMCELKNYHIQVHTTTTTTTTTTTNTTTTKVSQYCTNDNCIS
jgi:hypothetical protein